MSSDEWTTPKKLYQFLTNRCHFNLDCAATDKNALCQDYFTKERSALETRWPIGSRFFCNPPFSLDKEFAEHAYEQYDESCGLTAGVMILPVRSDRVWYQNLKQAPGIRFIDITGRLHFGGASKGAFMYNTLVLFGFNLPYNSLDAAQFNDSGKGGATK